MRKRKRSKRSTRSTRRKGEVDECHPHVRASMPHDRTKTMHPKPAPSRSHLQLVKRSAVERANGKVTAPWLLPTWQAARALSPLRGTSSQPLLSSAKNRLAPMLTPEDLARARRRIANASNDASSPPTKDASEDLRGALRTIALSAIASAGVCLCVHPLCFALCNVICRYKQTTRPSVRSN